MTLPAYRRTRGPFVILYRSFQGVETELAHAFGESAHAVLDSVQQEDLLTIAESAEGGMKEAMQQTMNHNPTINGTLPAKCGAWDTTNYPFGGDFWRPTAPVSVIITGEHPDKPGWLIAECERPNHRGTRTICSNKIVRL